MALIYGESNIGALPRIASGGGEEWAVYSRNLTQAEVIDLGANPIVAVPGQAGKIAVVRNLFLYYNNDGTTNYSGGAVGLGYDDSPSGTVFTGKIAEVVTGGTNPLYVYNLSPLSNNSRKKHAGLDLIIYHSSAFTAGAGNRSVDVNFEYMFIDNPIV